MAKPTKRSLSDAASTINGGGHALSAGRGGGYAGETKARRDERVVGTHVRPSTTGSRLDKHCGSNGIGPVGSKLWRTCVCAPIVWPGGRKAPVAWRFSATQTDLTNRVPAKERDESMRADVVVNRICHRRPCRCDGQISPGHQEELIVCDAVQHRSVSLSSASYHTCAVRPSRDQQKRARLLFVLLPRLFLLANRSTAPASLHVHTTLTFKMARQRTILDGDHGEGEKTFAEHQLGTGCFSPHCPQAQRTISEGEIRAELAKCGPNPTTLYEKPWKRETTSRPKRRRRPALIAVLIWLDRETCRRYSCTLIWASFVDYATLRDPIPT
uniref:Uncharacterized protein n=1 Tax=Plectus sambesii TaxID=2011161 RepID=A0A914UIZ3_9BILA